MFPSNSVMIDWHCLKINSLDEYFHKHLTEWLIDCSLAYNVKLKLSHVHDSSLWNTALAAITRIDLSENNLSSVPITLFTDLPSLKILNLSKNRLQTLPEIKTNQTEKTHDDSVSIFRTSTPINDQILPPSQGFGGISKKPRKLFSLMPKSQSVTTALSNVANTNNQDRAKSNKSTLKNNRSIDCAWNLPCLEELYLQDNQLECLPLSLFQQAELKILDLSNNKLRTLPPLFWFAPKLSELNLSLNLLCDLPSPVSCLNQMSLETNPNSPTTTITSTMSKSVSTSSISSNFKFDYETKNFQTTLLPFELNILKFWSGNVTILDNPFTEQFDNNNKTKMSTVNSQDSSTKSINGNSLMKNTNSCSLTQLNLSHNGFNRIPFFLSCLATRLTHLNISYNRIKSIFDPIYILGHFPLSLKHLDLSHNQISEWLYVDDDLEMDIGDDLNGFEAPCLHSFLWLQKQSCNNPTLEKHCPFKKHTKLDNLKTLILSNNSLSNLIITREELNEWIDLELINNRYIDSIRNNYVGNLSTSFNELSKHSSPALSTPITSKFYTNFGSQDDLQLNNDININYKATRYSKLFFPNLSMLDISHNYLIQIPKTISYLYQLSVFNFSGNSTLTSLPPEMGLLTKLWNLNTRGCNLGEPLQTMINSKSYKTCDIISYLNSILENSKPYNRLKLMIVGYQNIGKTSLLEQLRHEGHSRRGRATPDHWGKRIGNKSVNMKTQRGVSLSTVGVDLCEWTYEYRPLKGSNLRDRSLSRTRIANLQNSTKNLLDNHSIGPITFRTWDFGGQREYYATHQYFLSKRSIYLVVWKITDGEKGIVGLHSWLVNIQSRAPNSPVIIVGTHYDLVKEFYPPFFSTELQNMIRERYMSDSVDADKRGLPKVVASVEVSTKTNYNIRLLANLIYETACEMRSPGGKDKLLDQKVPATYLALEELVTSMAMERKSENLEPILHSDQFRQEVAHLMKERYDLTFRDYSELQQATRFLHENGVMLHYEDAHLKDLYFLDPQWLCDMLAHVVTIREINPFVKNGKMENFIQIKI